SSADCPLADEILEGTYRVECRLGDTTSAIAVDVKRYVLPKFKVAIEVDRPFYQPGESISGSVQADYFFGKPVTNADVRIDFGADSAGPAVETLAVHTDMQGRAEFSLRIPDALARSQELDGAPIQMKATVVDSAGQSESQMISRVLTTS